MEYLQGNETRETKDGEPLSIGRKSRVVPEAIERAVRARDMLDYDISDEGCLLYTSDAADDLLQV